MQICESAFPRDNAESQIGRFQPPHPINSDGRLKQICKSANLRLLEKTHFSRVGICFSSRKRKFADLKFAFSRVHTNSQICLSISHINSDGSLKNLLFKSGHSYLETIYFGMEN